MLAVVAVQPFLEAFAVLIVLPLGAAAVVQAGASPSVRACAEELMAGAMVPLGVPIVRRARLAGSDCAWPEQGGAQCPRGSAVGSHDVAATEPGDADEDQGGSNNEFDRDRDPLHFGGGEGGHVGVGGQVKQDLG